MKCPKDRPRSTLRAALLTKIEGRLKSRLEPM